MPNHQIYSSSTSDKHPKAISKLLSNSDHFQIIKKIRSRIHKILDEKFNFISQQYQKQYALKRYINRKQQSKSEITINESKLQEWAQMFKNEILQIKQKKDYENSRTLTNSMNILNFPRPLVNKQNQKIIFHIESNTLNSYKLDNHNLKNDYLSNKHPFNEHWVQNSYEFPEGFLKRFSTITYLQNRNQVIFIGGSKPSNLNIKSSKIKSFNLTTNMSNVLLHLPYGISSHAAVYHKNFNHIYVIGGNKNHSIVTRGCFKLDLSKMIVEQLSCLNYPVSSANCILWNNNWIYKFGGVGDAFGEWNTSPYIQRYSISANQWEVINPSIKKVSDIAFHNLFLANSSSYICEQDNKIFIFGGYTIQGEFQNQGFTFKIQQKQVNDQNQYQSSHLHIIQQYGVINCVPFINSCNNQIFAENDKKKIFMFSLSINRTKGIQPYLIETFQPLK